MPIIRNEYNARARGGTELSIEELERYVDPALLVAVNIIPGRWRGFPEQKLPLVFWVHDTADDPEMNHLANEGWKKFDMLVFVSYWQRQQFIDRFNIPYSRTRVIRNACVNEDYVNVDLDWSGKTPLNFIYHTTPHRGLALLAPAFIDAAKRVDFPIHLDVYSSYSVYGWEGADAPYEKLYNTIRESEHCTYHGAVPNAEVRAALRKAHVFVYPCVWPETGCRSLIEAMCEGVICITSDLAVLPETGMNLSIKYPYNEDLSAMAAMTRDIIIGSSKLIGSHDVCSYRRRYAASAARQEYDWNIRKNEWNDLLINMSKR